MSIADIDLEILHAEERSLEFPYFDPNVAWTLGSSIRDHAARESLPIALEISLAGHTLFFAALPGATPDNAAWIRRKRAVVERFHRSSLHFAVQALQQGRSFLDRYNLSGQDYTASGGGVPILVRRTGCVGTLVISGLPQEEDHRLALQSIRQCIDGMGNEEAAS